MMKTRIMMRVSVLAIALMMQGLVSVAHAVGVGGSGMFLWSVELRRYISNETGKAPVAYLWVPEGCKQVKAVMLSQQNMTEEAIYKNPRFQAKMKKLGRQRRSHWFGQPAPIRPTVHQGEHHEDRHLSRSLEIPNGELLQRKIYSVHE